MQAGNEEFMAVMREQGVDYVFAGRVRGYHSEKRGSVQYIISDGFDSTLGSQEGGGERPHFVRVTLSDSDVSLEWVPVAE